VGCHPSIRLQEHFQLGNVHCDFVYFGAMIRDVVLNKIVTDKVRAALACEHAAQIPIRVFKLVYCVADGEHSSGVGGGEVHFTNGEL